MKVKKQQQTKCQRNKNWVDIQSALTELIQEVNWLARCPTNEQAKSIGDACKTVHCQVLRFVREQEEQP